MNDMTFGACPLGLSGERLLQWRDRLLDPPEWQRIQDHLGSCSTCRSWLAAFAATRRQLRGLATPVGGIALWRDVQASMAPRGLADRALWRGAVAALIVAVIVVLFTLFFRNVHLPEVTPTPTPTRSALPLRWQQKSRPTPPHANLSPSPVIAASDGKTAYECLLTNNAAAIAPTIWVTHDDATNWTQSPPLQPLDANAQSALETGACAIMVNDTDANNAIVALGTVEIFITFDGGTSWQVLQHGPLYPITQFSSYQGKTYRIRASVTQPVLEVSQDHWQTWAPVDAPIRSAGETVSHFWIDQSTGEMLAVGQSQQNPGHLWQSDNGGASWTQLAVPPQLGSFFARPPRDGHSWQICVATTPQDGGTPTPFSSSCSVDGGQHWRTIAPPTQGASVTYALLGISGDGSVLLAAEQLPTSVTIFRQPPNATTWQSLSQAPQPQFVVYSPVPGVLWSLQLTGPKASGGAPDAYGVYLADFP